ncbi:hypothetical protein ACSU1N_05135 [Thermogladius sp. 4427co]|uniref:hypothetical protein n=1 Tax=Thermogladius sp. 4427co TaxID=3450718 RepID=UPI003F78F92A
MRILFVYNIYGNHAIAKNLCFKIIRDNIGYVFLAGDIGSPTIVKFFYKDCGVNVLGFTGRSDSELIVRELKAVNGYVESSTFKLDDKRFLAIGYLVQPGKIQSIEGIDILVSYLHPFKSPIKSATGFKSPLIDDYIKTLNPNTVILANCEKTLIVDNFACVGDVRKGYGLVLETSGEVFGYETTIP